MKATIAYLIKDNKIICELKTTLKSGRNVEFSSSYCEEFLNANREYNLINAKTAKISRAKNGATSLYGLEKK